MLGMDQGLTALPMPAIAHPCSMTSLGDLQDGIFHPLLPICWGKPH